MSPEGNGRVDRHTVAVIGAGYVGLPTAATLARFGHRVVLAEHEPFKLAALRDGRDGLGALRALVKFRFTREY